jgi:uncharacterized protein
MSATTTARPATAGAARATSGSTLEEKLFLGALALIALHVLDDNFLQPEPGTSAGDHLVSGLVPLVLLALAAAWYPRLRAGARGSVAVLLGVFGIATGIEGWHYSLEVGPSGDDFTGLLALPAGVVLIGTGVVTLWRSRRLDERLPRRYLRRALLGAGLLVVGVPLVYGVVYSYGLTHASRAVVPEAELGAPYEDVKFTTSDGLELEGWYVPSRNGAAVISFPGRAGTQKQARMLIRNGYGVLLFDRRGEGASEGDPNGLGWGGVEDVHAAIDFLRERPDVDPDRIGGIGRSVGGELLLEAAAENPALKAVVSDGAGIRSVREASLTDGAGKLGAVAVWSAMTVSTAVFSNEAPPPNLNDVVPRIAPRPVFLIHAERGVGGEELSAEYAEAAGEPVEVWEVPGAGHVGGIDARPAEYERRVVGFFERALLY